MIGLYADLLWMLRSAGETRPGDDPVSHLNERLLADIGLRRDQLPLYFLGVSPDASEALRPRANEPKPTKSRGCGQRLAVEGCG